MTPTANRAAASIALDIVVQMCTQGSKFREHVPKLSVAPVTMALYLSRRVIELIPDVLEINELCNAREYERTLWIGISVNI